MENGADYADALQDAQAKGYAEADPAGDLDGHDAAAKIVILANLVMGQSMTVDDVSCVGISGITCDQIQSAQAENQRWKLIGTLENVNGCDIGVIPGEDVSYREPNQRSGVSLFSSA